MVRLVDEALRDSALFGLSQGLASREVILADPAVGTGAYLLGTMRSYRGDSGKRSRTRRCSERDRVCG